MKLPKVSMRWGLGTAVAAMVMLQVVMLQVLLAPPFAPHLLILVLPILIFGCLLFFVRDMYIHGVTNKHPRVSIAARVVGAFGATVAFSLFLLFFYPDLPIPVGLYMSLVAIIGVKLALARPTLAGVLMLLAGMMPWILLYGRFPLDVYFDVFGLLWDPACIRMPDRTEVIMWFMITTFLTLSASSLPLIAGGVLTLLSARRKQPGTRVIVAFIVIPLIALIATVIFTIWIIVM